MTKVEVQGSVANKGGGRRWGFFSWGSTVTTNSSVVNIGECMLGGIVVGDCGGFWGRVLAGLRWIRLGPSTKDAGHRVGPGARRESNVAHGRLVEESSSGIERS